MDPPHTEYLVVAPHPDDAELGMGGTIAHLLSRGKSVAVVDLTSGEPTPFGTREKRREETLAACQVLGIEHRVNLGLPNRALEATLEARAALAEVYRAFRPRVLFVPYWRDAHPDHVAATELAIAARFHAKLTKTDMKGEPHYPERILHYYCTHLRRHDDVAFVADISEHFEAKIRAVECYQSQFYEGRGHDAASVTDYVRTLCRYWGSVVGCTYGEPFASQELLGLATPECIL